MSWFKKAKLMHKFAVALALMIVPIALLSVFFYKSEAAVVDSSRLEADGATALAPVANLYKPLGEYHLQVARASLGDAEARAAAAQSAADFEQALSAVTHDKALMDRLELTEYAGRIQKYWSGARSAAEARDYAGFNRQYAQLLGEIEWYYQTAIDTSALVLDPELSSFHLMLSALDKAPRLNSSLDGVAIAAILQQRNLAEKTPASEPRVALARQMGYLANLFAQLDATYNEAIEADDVLLADLKKQKDELLRRGNELVAAAELLVQGRLVAGSVDQLAREVQSLSVDAQNLAVAGLGKVLERRVAQSNGIVYRNLAIGLGAMLMALAVAVVVTRSATRRLRTAIAAFGHIAEGEYQNAIVVDSSDEAGQVLAALDSMQKSLHERDERERPLAAENLRIRTALDCVSGNVMMADSSNRIVYMNRSVTKLFETAAADLRRDLPHFDASKLMGQTIDVFHRNPAHQTRLLAELHGTHTARMKVGGRSMQIIANPVMDDQGRRSGTVVEWVDRTQEVMVEEEVSSIVAAARDGDLTRRISTEGKQGFYETLATGVNGLLENTSTIISQIRLAAGEVQTGAEEISKGNTDLSQRTEEQASILQETAASMDQMTATVKQNAENAGHANQLAMAARGQAERGGTVVGSAVEAVGGISEASKKIADIIGVIDEIAFQTNLLALNAAVEAARAGEQGRGFAVVAQEVRNLAGRSATAAKEIKELIRNSVNKVEEGKALVDESGRTLGEIMTAIKKVTDIVAEIAAASGEQSRGIEGVNTAVKQMDITTQQNAALVEEAAAASQAIVEQTHSLGKLIAKYKLTKDQTGYEVRPGVFIERRSANRPWAGQGKEKDAPQVKGGSRQSDRAKGAADREPARAVAKAAGGDSGSEWQEF